MRCSAQAQVELFALAVVFAEFENVFGVSSGRRGATLETDPPFSGWPGIETCSRGSSTTVFSAIDRLDARLKAENQALRQMVGGEGRFPLRLNFDDRNGTPGVEGCGDRFYPRAHHRRKRHRQRGHRPLDPRNESAQRISPSFPSIAGQFRRIFWRASFSSHAKGAVTGADRARKGLFSQADRALFLDEIGELPLHMQTKLLHVIEDKEVRPWRPEQARRVDVRIVAATNRNLGDMVKGRAFPEDLYFRLSVFHIHIPCGSGAKTFPPIRFVPYGMGGNGKKQLELDPMAEEILVDYPWPGNVRELENVINRAYILADGGRISLADLPPDIARQTPVRERSGMDVCWCRWPARATAPGRGRHHRPHPAGMQRRPASRSATAGNRLVPASIANSKNEAMGMARSDA